VDFKRPFSGESVQTLFDQYRILSFAFIILKALQKGKREQRDGSTILGGNEARQDDFKLLLMLSSISIRFHDIYYVD